MRKCYWCKQLKEINEFEKDSTRVSGFRYICKKCERIRTKEYYEKNKIKINKRNNDWRKKNPDKNKEMKERYRKSLVGSFKATQAVYRRRKLLKNKGIILFEDWNSLLAKVNYRCACCRKKFSKNDKACIDHIIPVSKGGLNIIENTQPLCRRCNSKKKDKAINYLILLNP